MKNRIFIVEDDVGTVDMLVKYLSKFGNKIISTSSAEGAIAILREMKSFDDVFLVDMQLTGKMNGVDFVAWLRENGAYNPVVMMTGHTSPELVQKCLDELGVDCFIDKPASLELVQSTLEKAVNTRGRMSGIHEGVFIEQSRDGSIRQLFYKRKLEFLSMHLPGRRVPRITCISSQMGCKMGCKFCATGMQVNKHVRNLSAEEMLQQVYVSQDCYQERRNVDVLIMGMGEPSCNLKHIFEFVERLDKNYIINISTVGVVPKLHKLVKLFKGNERVGLQFSLQFPWDELRAKHMPVAKNNPLAKIIPLLEDFSCFSFLPVAINYVLFKGLNDRDEHIEMLVRLVQGKRFEVKLSEANPFGIYQPVAISRVEEIEKILDSYGVSHHRFFSKGKDDGWGCGQMTAKIRTRR